MRSKPRHGKTLRLWAYGPDVVLGLWWCPVCGAAAHRMNRPGRPKVYCSNACRQRAYRWRREHGITTRATPTRPAERSITFHKRHAMRSPKDFVAGLRGFRDREVTACGAFAKPARDLRYTHNDFVPDHPWSCQTCVRLVAPP